MMRFFGIIMILGVIAAAACSRGNVSEGPATVVSDARTYVVRGEVVSVPRAGNPGAQFIVQHEPLEDFRNSSGRVVGMGAMGMPFTPGKGVSLEGIEPGDKIEMKWVVQWKPEAREYVESVRKLPGDTQLRLGTAGPPTTSSPTMPSGHQMPGR